MPPTLHWVVHIILGYVSIEKWEGSPGVHVARSKKNIVKKQRQVELVVTCGRIN